MFKRNVGYEVWYDLETFYNETLEDEKTPVLKKKDAKEVAKQYKTHKDYEPYKNVRIVKVRRTTPRWLNR